MAAASGTRSNADATLVNHRLRELMRAHTAVRAAWFVGLFTSAACATNPPSARDPLAAWDDPQPQCYLGDAIVAGRRTGTQASDGAVATRVDGRGSIDRSEVAHVVHAHLEEVRYCYKKGLELDPGLGGDVVVRFTVGRGGHVLSSSVASSTVADFEVQACVARAVCRWMFEAPPEGANVSVTYPFALVASRAAP